MNDPELKNNVQIIERDDKRFGAYNLNTSH